MKRKLSVLLLALLCLLAFTGCCFHSQWYTADCTTPKTCIKCGKTQGEVLDHTWVDATCEAPRTCSVCHLTEGEALAHAWADATTEAPRICTVCGATGGARIVTDERFTTASTLELQGLWSADIFIYGEDMGFDPAYMNGNAQLITVHMLYTMGLHQDGTIYVGTEVLNAEEFYNGLTEYYTNAAYAKLAGLGYDKEAGSTAYQEAYGKTVEEDARENAEASDISNDFAWREIGVYYVESGIFYSAGDWDNEMKSTPFTLEGDTLTLTDPIGFVEEITLTRTAD